MIAKRSEDICPLIIDSAKSAIIMAYPPILTSAGKFTVSSEILVFTDLIISISGSESLINMWAFVLSRSVNCLKSSGLPLIL